MTWLGAVVIGLSLGLLGSGGSILTVPVLVYFAGIPEKVAIAESLVIVGLIAAGAAVPRAFRREVKWRSVMLFGLPGMLGSYLGAWVAQFVSAAAQLSLFGLVMLLAAGFMFRPPRLDAERPERRGSHVALDGLVVGALTGLVGVGGGFLIVPALVLLGGLPMVPAIATSLVVIALKSFAGFLKYRDVLGELGFQLDWGVITLVASLGIAGSFAGAALADRLPRRALEKTFAAFLIVMAAVVLVQYAPTAF